MKSRFLALIFFALVANTHAQTSSVYNLRSDTVDVLHYNIHLEIKDFVTNVIKGHTVVTLSPKMPSVNKVCFDLIGMTIDSVVFNGTPLSTSYNDTLLVCHFPSPVNDIDTVDVKVYYHGQPEADPSWGGFYFQSGYAYNLGVAFTSVPHNFGRTWHPCFDNFVEHATYEMHITTTGTKRAYCNGLMESEIVSGADVTRKWVMNDPIPSYLACVAVNSYTHVEQEHISTVTGNHIPIHLIALPTDTTKFKNSFINLPVAIAAYEEHFHPYEWDKVGFVAVPFSSGAMEHATCIAYPVSTLTGATTYQNLMAHELSHHWWGDLVTCETAEDMWINEGMARWCEALFFEQLTGYSTGYMNDIRPNHKKVVWRAHIEDGGWYPISGVPQNVTYGSTTYEKGADMIHTLRGYLGDSLFFAGLKDIQNMFMFKNMNAIEFRDRLNTFLSPVSVTDYFNDWVLQPGFPEFAVDSMVVSGSTPLYSANVWCKQKLRGAVHDVHNVPMQVTFMDHDFNRYTTKQLLSGPATAFTVNMIPFVPEIVFFNEDEKISEAVTANEQFITTIGSKSFSNANMNLQVQSVADSVWARVEQHWVAADGFSPSNFLYTVSPDRFWRVHVLGDVAHFNTKATLSYNGTTSGAGHLDNGLMATLVTGTFSEDSLRMLYRAHPGNNWQVLNTATFTVGSKTDKVGSISIDSLKAGDYALGMKTSAVGISEVKKKKRKLNVFPNPTNGVVTVEVKNSDFSHDSILIMDQQGNKVMTSEIRSSRTELNVSNLSPAAYFVTLFTNGKPVETQKLIVK